MEPGSSLPIWRPYEVPVSEGRFGDGHMPVWVSPQTHGRDKKHQVLHTCLDRNSRPRAPRSVPTAAPVDAIGIRQLIKKGGGGVVVFSDRSAHSHKCTAKANIYKTKDQRPGPVLDPPSSGHRLCCPLGEISSIAFWTFPPNIGPDLSPRSLGAAFNYTTLQ